MLIPELTILASIAALFVALTNSLFIWWGRQDMHQKLEAARQEQRAINSAAYGLARHLKYLQSQLEEGVGKASSKKSGFDETSADSLVDQGIDSLKLSESLGVSQNEAEVIAYLRPLRKAKA
ncbi:MAG: hypothetical protein ACI9FB_004374 [Candidatus Azotimanducaceae bacterium]|jgi:hypothetical protein